jgi:hypothetical protein
LGDNAANRWAMTSPAFGDDGRPSDAACTARHVPFANARCPAVHETVQHVDAPERWYRFDDREMRAHAFAVMGSANRSPTH